MLLIHAPITGPDSELREVAVRVDRLKLSKRLWRGQADDGLEFGFELATPLKDGDAIWQATSARYVIRQEHEPVLEVSLELPPSAAAGIGWAIGNLHMELSAEPTRLFAPDDPAVRQLLDRLGVPFRACTALFRPGRFARGQSVYEHEFKEFGLSHRH